MAKLGDVSIPTFDFLKKLQVEFALEIGAAVKGGARSEPKVAPRMTERGPDEESVGAASLRLRGAARKRFGRNSPGC